MLKLEPVYGKNEAKSLYSHIKRDFPINERFPFFILQKGLENGSFNAYYLSDDEDIVGYFVCTEHKNKPYVHIHFFAVLPQLRASGFGSRAIKSIEDRFKDAVIILEAENPEYGKKDLIIRQKRLKFYKKAGFFLQKDIKMRLFGTEMVMLANTSRTIPGRRELWLSGYRPQMPLKPFIKCIEIYDAPGFGHKGKYVKTGTYADYSGKRYEALRTVRDKDTGEILVLFKEYGGDMRYFTEPAESFLSRTRRIRHKCKF